MFLYQLDYQSPTKAKNPNVGSKPANFAQKSLSVAKMAVNAEPSSLGNETAMSKKPLQAAKSALAQIPKSSKTTVDNDSNYKSSLSHYPGELTNQSKIVRAHELYDSDIQG